MLAVSEARSGPPPGTGGTWGQVSHRRRRGAASLYPSQVWTTWCWTAAVMIGRRGTDRERLIGRSLEDRSGVSGRRMRTLARATRDGTELPRLPRALTRR